MINFYKNYDNRFELSQLNRIVMYFVVAAASSVLAACGGSSEGDAPQALSATSDSIIQIPANTISRVGIITFVAADAKGLAELGLPSGAVGAKAEFIDYGQVISEDYIASEFSINTIETCSITIDSSDNSQDLGLENDSTLVEFESNSRIISAGSALSISTPSGSWPDLVLSTDTDPNYTFQTDTSTLGDMPKGTTISIPGDGFPAFDRISIPILERFTNVSMSNVVEGLVTHESKMTWTLPKTITAESITTISSYTEVIDSTSNSELTIEMSCNVTDDGEFSFPANARQLLSQYNLPAEDFTLSRVGVASETRGDAAIIVLAGAIYYF